MPDDFGFYDKWRSFPREQIAQWRARRADRDEALAHKRAQAELTAAYKAQVKARKRAEKEARDQRRGYEVDPKRLVMSVVGELVIASVSAYGQYLFAQEYSTDWLTTQQMTLAPIAYAMVEFFRVPLALSTRTHPQRFIRLVAFLGVLGAAGITVKSMSQLGDMMFAPRLTGVVVAREKLDLAQAADERMIQRIAVADELVEQRLNEQHVAVDKEKASGTQLAGLPKPICHPESYYNRRANAVITTTVCTPDPRGTPLASNLNIAELDVKNAQTAYEAALTERKRLDRTSADQALSDARAAYREAVRNSQLHDFVSMVWGIAPTEVTDAMVARFLRWFVFGAAVCVAFASTMIAFTAITRVKPATIRLNPAAGEYILGPFAQEAAEMHARVDAAVKAAAEMLARVEAAVKAAAKSTTHTKPAPENKEGHPTGD